MISTHNSSKILLLEWLDLLYDTIMASESNFESCITDLTSEPSQTSHMTVRTGKQKAKTLKIWDYCRELPESEAQEDGKLIYGCNQCVFKTDQMTNFRMHYLNQHEVDIPMNSGRAHHM